MVLSNFRNYKEVPVPYCGGITVKVLFADVDVTTGSLWWKKTNTRRIAREHGSYWTFVDTGRTTPGFLAENLESAYKLSVIDRSTTNVGNG